MQLLQHLPLQLKTEPSQLAGAGTAHGLMRTCTLHALMPMETLVMKPHARARMMPALMELMMTKLAIGTLTAKAVMIQDTAVVMVLMDGTVLLMIKEILSNALVLESLTSRLMRMVTNTGSTSAHTMTAKAPLKTQKICHHPTHGLLQETSSLLKMKVQDGKIYGMQTTMEFALDSMMNNTTLNMRHALDQTQLMVHSTLKNFSSTTHGTILTTKKLTQNGTHMSAP